jgi:glycosyltransferase involved in cell wall biosynthesis
MIEFDNILKEAIERVGANGFSKAISSRSFLARQLWRRFTRGRDATQVLGMADILNRYAGGREASILSAHDTTKLQTGIGVYGLFTAEIGIGQSARRSAQALRTAGVPVSLHNVLIPQLFENRIDFGVSDGFISPYDTALIHLNPDGLLQLLALYPIDGFVGRRRIGFWHWELPVFPAPWAKAFDKVQEVWVPSSFVARAVAAAGGSPVRVIPHAVDCDEISQDLARKSLQLPADEFFFLAIFDVNSFPTRKNPLGIVRAFVDAFPRAGPSSPRLIVKCHGKGNRNSTFDELLRHIHDDARVLLLDQVFSPEQIRQLQAACDCYISLHRSEGFGLNILESMALGKPCIATGFSGNMDFMTADNSIIIPFEMRRVEKGEYLHGEGQWWAEPDHDISVDALRRVALQGQDIVTLAGRARDVARRDYSFQRVGELSRAAWRGEATPYGRADRSSS